MRLLRSPRRFEQKASMVIFRNPGAKVLLFFELCKFLENFFKRKSKKVFRK